MALKNEVDAYCGGMSTSKGKMCSVGYEGTTHSSDPVQLSHLVRHVEETSANISKRDAINLWGEIQIESE